MAIDMRSVYSSHVNEIGHDPDANELHVIWDSGKHSVYSGVSYEKFESVARSWSVGKSLHEHIKPYHGHRYL